MLSNPGSPLAVAKPTFPGRRVLPPASITADTTSKLRRKNADAALRFTKYALCIGLFGTRFGIPVGGTQISLVGPVILGLAGLAVYRGVLQFDRIRTSFFLLFCAFVIFSAAINMSNPNLFAVPPSWPSFFQMLTLTSLFVVGFKEPPTESEFFTLVNRILNIIAICGIIQFVVQFAGLKLFSFQGILPDSVLYEAGYNTTIPIGTSDYFKSNGAVLLEPSMFSQFMALGLCIEILALRRMRYVLMFLCGLIVSSAGTGWLILGSFIIAMAVGMKARGFVLALATVGLLAMGLVVMAFAAPDFFDSFVGRIGEFSAPGSSGHSRFIAPLWALQDVLWREPWALSFGIGAGLSERLISLTYEQSMNTPIKLFIEFGLPATLAYVALLVSGRKTRAQTILLVPGIVMLFIAGSYAQVPPMLYTIGLIVCIPMLRTDDERPPPAIPAPGVAAPARRLTVRALQ